MDLPRIRFERPADAGFVIAKMERPAMSFNDSGRKSFPLWDNAATILSGIVHRAEGVIVAIPKGAASISN